MATTEIKQIETIGTHSGAFHCDEAMAIALLQFLPRFQNAKIYRSRDPEFLNTLDMLVDVGSVYDHNSLRYDHHQREFQDTFNNEYTIRLSSAGLVYKHYGLDVIKSLVADTSSPLFTGITPAQIDVSQKTFKENPATYELIFQRIYRRLILALDGIDNGVQQYPIDVKPAYDASGFLPDRISRLNPSWTEDLYITPEQKAAAKLAQAENQENMEAFKKAIELCREEFLSVVRNNVLNWLSGRAIVENAVKDRLNGHSSGRIVNLSSFCPWKSHFFDLLAEDTTGELDKILFFIYPSGTSWRYLAVPDTEDSFTLRVKAPDSWKGLRDAQLEEASGVSDLTPAFIHHTFFTGGCATKDGLIQLLEKTLEHHDKQ